MELKNKILELRALGWSYKKIAEEVDCAISTVSYHCSDGQKEKNLNRSRKRRQNPLIGKIDHFRNPGAKYRNRRPEAVKSNSKKLIRHKADDFQRRTPSGRYGKRNIQFTYYDVINKFGIETECYLTGTKINLLEPRTYQFDHKIPATKGGDNSIENLGIVCPEVNWIKTNMTIEETLAFCEKVLKHNGYTVIKN
jgi:5-methylcytosine-specific restriction endonuclease McrA